jgi:chromate transporter
MLAGLAFLVLYFLNVSFPLVIIASGILGIIYGKMNKTENSSDGHVQILLPNFYQTLKTVAVWLVVWMTPLVFTLLYFGRDSTFHSLNVFFSKMSMVTFGGAYSTLSYVAQVAVNDFGWLNPGEMLDGLAMAETTPGPLIQTVQFVGFMGAYRSPDIMNPYLSGFIASVLTTWMTFAPCFLWIFTFAPYVEYIRGKKVFSDVLAAISATVVGVILNLSVWFAINTLFVNSNVDIAASFICIVALVMQFKFQASLFKILGVSMVLGIISKMFLHFL